jgi:hypothetical protein
VRPSALSEKVSNEAFHGADDWRLYDLNRPKAALWEKKKQAKPDVFFFAWKA